MELVLASEANHQQTDEGDDGRKDEEGQSRLGLEDAVIASCFALGIYVRQVATEDCTNQVTNYSLFQPSECKHTGSFWRRTQARDAIEAYYPRTEIVRRRSQNEGAERVVEHDGP